MTSHITSRTQNGSRKDLGPTPSYKKNRGDLYMSPLRTRSLKTHLKKFAPKSASSKKKVGGKKTPKKRGVKRNLEFKAAE
jgi:hypothetical protein